MRTIYSGGRQAGKTAELQHYHIKFAIERLARASESCYALDHTVFMALKFPPGADLCLNYTTSIDDALTLIPKGWGRTVDASRPDRLVYVRVDKSTVGGGIGLHESEPIATCLAVLRGQLAVLAQDICNPQYLIVKDQ